MCGGSYPSRSEAGRQRCVKLSCAWVCVTTQGRSQGVAVLPKHIRIYLNLAAAFATAASITGPPNYNGRPYGSEFLMSAIMKSDALIRHTGEGKKRETRFTANQSKLFNIYWNRWPTSSSQNTVLFVNQIMCGNNQTSTMYSPNYGTTITALQHHHKYS